MTASAREDAGPAGSRTDDSAAELAAAARGGDRAAARALVRATQPQVWRLLAALAGVAVADQLTENIYVRAFRTLPRDQPPADVRVWLLRIARDACDDHLRTVSRRRRLHLAVGEPATGDGDEACGTVVGPDLLDRVVDEAARAAFVLTQVVGLSYAEASVVEQIPVGTIRSRVARARTDLIGRPDPSRS